MERADFEQDEQWLLFGLFLRFRRLRAELTVADLVALLARVNYVALTDEIDAFERGSSVPRDPQRFLRAVYSSLSLDERATYALARYLGFHWIATEYGPDTAHWFFFWTREDHDWRSL